MYKKILIIFIVFILVNAIGLAMPTSDITQIVDIQYNRNTYSFLPDSSQPSIYYYIPQKIIFVTSGIEDKPKFQMIKFQTSSTELEQIYQGGILQFSFKFVSVESLDSEIINKLKSKTQKNQIDVKNLSIEASDFIFLNSTNTFVKGVQVPLEKFQINPNSHIPIGLTLDNKGCNYFKELITSPNGLPIVARLNFKSVSENMNLKVKLNYTKAASELKKNSSFRASFNDFVTRKLGMDLSSTASHLRETMISNSILKIESIEKTNNDSHIDKYIGLFVDRIIKNIATLDQDKEKERKSTSLFTAPKRRLVTLGYGYSIIKQEKITQVDETINFSGKSEIAMPLMAQGNLSIAPFMKKHNVKEDKFIKFIMPSSIQSFFMLPELEDLGDLDISKFSIKIRLVNRYGKDIPKTSRSVVIADMEDLVWRDSKMAARDILAFGIPDSCKNDKGVKYICDFIISYKVGRKKHSLNFTKEYPAFNGEIPITAIEDFIQIITIDGKRLEYNSDGKLRAVNINLSWGNSKNSKVTGSLSRAIERLTFLIPSTINGIEPIVVGKLTFFAKKRKRILNYKSILEERGNFVRLKNWEWQEDND